MALSVDTDWLGHDSHTTQPFSFFGRPNMSVGLQDDNLASRKIVSDVERRPSGHP
jgi:hypothetical protein